MRQRRYKVVVLGFEEEQAPPAPAKPRRLPIAKIQKQALSIWAVIKLWSWQIWLACICVVLALLVLAHIWI